ncbi:hypothetical protein NE237_021909 [Protea cynaroides]|uniref:Uncharacterized protein n=1 Tax=Protea cynaroides TaxID=273540 RepID=A0A9Q0K316_9MAGN|nr:hypothetical protein NE237_021909 [Protea cynaroides]
MFEAFLSGGATLENHRLGQPIVIFSTDLSSGGGFELLEYRRSLLKNVSGIWQQYPWDLANLGLNPIYLCTCEVWQRVRAAEKDIRISSDVILVDAMALETFYSCP